MNLAAQFVVDVSVLTAVVGCLSCYHCISRIDADHADQTEKLALKTALFTRYNVPPSHEDCAGGSEDLMFRAVAKETCAQKDDQCVRIVSAVEETTPPVQLVMRGCLSTLFQPGFELSRQPNCSHFEESQCLCNTTLCNSAISPVNKLQIISALLLFLNRVLIV